METVIATNGKAYKLNKETGKATKVFNHLKELKGLKASLQKSMGVEYQTYVKHLKDVFKEEVVCKQNYITIRGYRLKFTAEGIHLYDIMNFGEPIEFETPPTPGMISDYIKPQHRERKFSPMEMGKAAERGKKLLEERKEVPVAEIVEAITIEDLEKLKQKAIRLIKRIKLKQTDAKRLIEEVPTMVPFRRLKINLTLAVKNYTQRKLRWAGFVAKVEQLLQEEDFMPTPKKGPKFTGLDIPTWKVCGNEIKDDKLIVDGKEVPAYKFLVKHLLRRDKQPEMMPQIMKYCKGEITAKELIDNPIKKDAYEWYNEELFDKLTGKDELLIHKLFIAAQEVYLLSINYATGLKKGQKVLVLSDELCSMDEGKVVSTEQGTHIFFPAEGTTCPIIKHQKFEVI